MLVSLQIVAEAGADADRDLHRLALRVNGRRERGDDLLEDSDHPARLACIDQNQRELVSADARDGVGLAYALAESRCHRPQDRIADGVPEPVVDRLEAIDVGDREGECLVPSRRALEHLAEAVHEEAAIRQVGERIVGRRMPEPIDRPHAIAHVAPGRHEMHDPAGLVLDRPDRLLLVEEAAAPPAVDQHRAVHLAPRDRRPQLAIERRPVLSRFHDRVSAPDQLRAGISGHLLERGVHELDDAVRVGDRHRVRGLLGRPGEPLQHREPVRPPAPSAKLEHDRAPAVDVQGTDARLERQSRAVRAEQRQWAPKRRLRGRPGRREILVPRFGRKRQSGKDRGYRAADELRVRAADQ
jgi:hypothetical protein